MGIHFVRWRYLLRLISPEVTNNEVFTSLMVGIAAGFFTPAQVGEFAGRIASHPALRKSSVAGMTAIDKLYLIAVTFISGIIGLTAFISTHLNSYWHSSYFLIVILLVMLFIAVFSFPHQTKKIFSLLPKKLKAHRFYNVIDAIETRFFNKNGRILFVLTALLFAINFLQYYLFVRAFEPVSLLESVMCSSSVFFVKAFVLPISIGDLGVRESTAIFFYSKIGIAAATAFNASFCLFLSNIFLPSVIGALLIVRLKIT